MRERGTRLLYCDNICYRGIMKRCFYCEGQFGLTRRKWSGRQFCSLWCLAWFENELRERKKTEEFACLVPPENPPENYIRA